MNYILNLFRSSPPQAVVKTAVRNSRKMPIALNYLLVSTITHLTSERKLFRKEPPHNRQ